MDQAVGETQGPGAEMRLERSASSEPPSVLFSCGHESSAGEIRSAPACFKDLNLDQVVAAVVAPKADYDLTPFFYQPLTDTDAIGYRHEVFRDLEKPLVAAAIEKFADEMKSMRDHLGKAEKLHHNFQKQSWFLDACSIYVGAVERLGADIDGTKIRSRGLLAFRNYLARYATTREFQTLRADTEACHEGLAQVRYSLLIRSSSVQIRKYEPETDYSAEVTKTFKKFQHGPVPDFTKAFTEYDQMNHVEAGILAFVARLHPEAFQALERHCATHAEYLNPVIARFDREVQFYVAWLDHLRDMKRAGLVFCYPEVSASSKQVRNTRCFDIALANKFVAETRPVITNDFHLDDNERIIVVSGPNQGGKTTFARMFGQLHYLAALGCPVPGHDAQLFLFDRIFTHFEREEDLASLRGKLEDELVRIHEILGRATPQSVVIINEIFTSTTLDDAIVLAGKVMSRVVDLDLLCVCVTFIDELAQIGGKVVSMVSTVAPENPSKRTYKIIRKPADGRAYAKFMAEQHGLTYDRIRKRIRR